MIKVAVFVGSLRKGSYSMMLAKHMKARYADRFDLEILDVNLPLFNEDINTEELRPESARELVRKVEESDAVLFITPEYNHAVSGVMKNAIDWASRPGEGKKGLIGKVALKASSSTGATAGARAYLNLLVILDTLAVKSLPGNDIMVGLAHTKYDADGKLIDEGTVTFIDTVMKRFESWYKKFEKSTD